MTLQPDIIHRTADGSRSARPRTHRVSSHRPKSRRLRAGLLLVVALAMLAAACEFNPAQFPNSPALSHCDGVPATIGIGWYEPADGPAGSSYVGTEGDDVVVITNGPVSFDGLGGDDLICVNDTGLASSTPPIKIDAGPGDDMVWDRRYRDDPAPSHVALEVDLGEGADRFYGSAAKDVVAAGSGDDEVNGGGGVDQIDCGPDTDLRWVGDYTHPDTQAQNCENEGEGFGPVDETAVQALLDAFRVDKYVFGTQMGLRVPGQPDTFVASGVDDRFPEETPMPTDGTFTTSAITKSFTSAVTLQLVEQGELDFEATLDNWLPDYPYADQITIRMMLEHTSGMADYMNDPATNSDWSALMWSDLGRVWTLEEVLALNATAEPHGPPPQELADSSGNYWALGYIIEQITGRSIGQVFEERIFEPYGLDDTTYDDGTATVTQHGWWGFNTGNANFGTFDPTVPRDFDAYGFPRTAFQTFFGSVGAVVSSTDDLLDWAEVLYGGGFLGDELDAEFHTLDHIDNWAGGDRRYGLGIVGFCPCDDTTDPPTASVVGYTGSFKGAALTTSTVFGYDTQTGIAVAVRSNVGEVSLIDRGQLLLDAIDLIS